MRARLLPHDGRACWPLHPPRAAYTWRSGPRLPSKMILIRSESRLAIHITSANLTRSEFSAKTNAVWSGCFERKGGAAASSSSDHASSGFESDLLEYMDALSNLGQCPPANFVARHADGKEACGPNDAMRWLRFETDWLREYDYSTAQGVRLVAGVPARNAQGHNQHEMQKWGQCKLRSLLSLPENRLSPDLEGLPLVIQFTSMGLPQNPLPWVKQMIRAFCPHDEKLPPLRVSFPTTQEVRDSLMGWVSGKSIPCADGRPMKAMLDELELQETVTRKQYTARMCRWGGGDGERSRAAPHLKSFTRCADAGSADDASNPPWVVIGSHNFSKAAWGELDERSTALLGMRSYELSVLITPSQLPPNTTCPPLPHLPVVPYQSGDTIWQNSWRSNSVTDNLPLGITGNTGSVDHHGKRPEVYDKKTTWDVIYGKDAAAVTLLTAWDERRKAAGIAEEMRARHRRSPQVTTPQQPAANPFAPPVAAAAAPPQQPAATTPAANNTSTTVAAAPALPPRLSRESVPPSPISTAMAPMRRVMES